MLRFIIVFLTTYGLMHTLFFLRVRVLLPDGRWLRWGCFLFLIYMVFAPMICHTFERMGHDLPARMTAFVGYYWMGFLLLGCAAALLMGIFDLGAWGLRTISNVHLPPLSGKKPAMVMLCIVSTCWLYGIFEARNMKMEHLRVETDKLPDHADPLRIVQISDVHLGLTARDKKLKAITDKVQSLSPDILVCTGDLLDTPLHHLPELAAIFQQIRPRYGKYAVTGNHEYYAGLVHAVDFMEKSGFTVLRGTAKTIHPLINIAGIDDRVKAGSAEETALLTSLQNGLFTLFLRHQPVVSKRTAGLFDLQLSGHTHGGQIFPLHLITSRIYPFFAGYYEIQKGSAIYVSRGTGTWGPPIRILAPPEITLIELTSSGSD